MCAEIRKSIRVSHKIEIPANKNKFLFDKFSSYSEQQQRALSQATLAYYKTTVATHGETDKTKIALTHCALNSIRFDDSLEKEIEKNLCVEMYNIDLIQTFRSPNFYKYTDYSIEELITLPYYEMFTRSNEVNGKILKNALAILNGSHNGPNWGFIEDNIVKEVGSGRVSKASCVVVAPIHSTETYEIVGLIQVFNVVSHHRIMAMN
jgi:hypothetical protein